MSDDLKQRLITLAGSLLTRAAGESTPLEEGVRVLKEVRELYATLTKPSDPGDKPASGRRPTMSKMRERISKARGGPNGRADPALQDPVD